MNEKSIVEMCEDTNPATGCFFLESWEVNWYTIEIDGIKYLVMPNINSLRINYCPACGAYIREVQIEKE